MHKLKTISKNLFYSVYGFFSAYYTAGFLSVAFNFGKGICYNPEGAMFIPVGIVILLAILMIDIVIIVKTLKSDNMSKLEKALTILLFIIVKIIGLMLDQNGWRNFIHCFKWKFTQ